MGTIIRALPRPPGAAPELTLRPGMEAEGFHTLLQEVEGLRELRERAGGHVRWRCGSGTTGGAREIDEAESGLKPNSLVLALRKLDERPDGQAPKFPWIRVLRLHPSFLRNILASVLPPYYLTVMSGQRQGKIQVRPLSESELAILLHRSRHSPYSDLQKLVARGQPFCVTGDVRDLARIAGALRVWSRRRGLRTRIVRRIFLEGPMLIVDPLSRPNPEHEPEPANIKETFVAGDDELESWREITGQKAEGRQVPEPEPLTRAEVPRPTPIAGPVAAGPPPAINAQDPELDEAFRKLMGKPKADPYPSVAKPDPEFERRMRT